ncbi:MAG: hypothetical protein EA355_13370 [Rhodobacteraceae bacterium]|nr:MAG: hypothetical protein EA355_13370 [Paracoccaceae bacterium]
MSYQAPIAPTLFDLLGRSWTLDAPVAEVCFNRAGEAVAFRAGAGLAIAALADPERPETRIRIAADDGRRTIAPRRNPPRPLARADGLAGPVAAYGGKSFVTGSARGGLVSVTQRGQVTPLATPFDGPLDAIARDPASAAVAAASGARVLVLPDDADAPPLRLEAPGPVAALAYAPDGRLLAAAHEAGVMLWRDGAPLGVVEVDRPATLSFAPDGGALACGLADHGFALIDLSDFAVETVADYPTPVRSFAWLREPAALAASGAFRITAWLRDGHGLGAPIEAGRVGLVVVERMAGCPTRPLIAAGYANGLLCLARAGGRDEMLLRVDGPPPTAFAWSADGAHLAVGDAAGGAALLAFPADLFK